MKKKNIFGYTSSMLEMEFIEAGLPKFLGKQIVNWLYKNNVTSFSLMSNISKLQRIWLETNYAINRYLPERFEKSNDGTIKYLFLFKDNTSVETVYIPEKDRHTVCISTQTGCKLGCKFCMTGKSKQCRNLDTGEILSQVVSIPDFKKITNIVIMGMGEPLMNAQNVFDAIQILTSPQCYGIGKHRITLSTVGIISELKHFLQKFPCELAVSLHSPFSEERKNLMPIEHTNPIAEVTNLIRHYTKESARTISFEYIVFNNLNHSKHHAEQLVKILNGIPAKINLMRYHYVKGFDYQSPNEAEIVAFQNILKEKGFQVTIRKSRGIDISAACGLLSALQNKEL